MAFAQVRVLLSGRFDSRHPLSPQRLGRGHDPQTWAFIFCALVFSWRTSARSLSGPEASGQKVGSLEGRQAVIELAEAAVDSAHHSTVCNVFSARGLLQYGQRADQLQGSGWLAADSEESQAI